MAVELGSHHLVDSPPAGGLAAMAVACPRCLPGLALTPPWLDDAGNCPVCQQLWPLLQVGGRTLPVLVPDPMQGLVMAEHVKALIENPGLLHTWADGDDATKNALAHGLLTYCQAHFGQWTSSPLPHPDLSWLRGWLPLDLPAGQVLILGGGPGGELAALAADPALEGREICLSDSNLATLAWGQWLAQDGALALPWRTSATRIGWAETVLPAAAHRQLAAAQWVCADALHPPWPAGSAAAVVSLALIDTVSDPIALIEQVEALLAPGGVWLLASPWCWQNWVTPLARQLERFVEGDDLDSGLAMLLTGQGIAGLGSGFQLERYADHVPWTLQMHPRFQANYSLQVMLLRRA